MASKEYIERLQMAIHQLHGCDSKHVETVPVKEVFKGETGWEGEVEVFEVAHADANQVFAWSHKDDTGQEHFTAVLAMPPVVTPLDAVRSYLVTEIKKREWNRKWG